MANRDLSAGEWHTAQSADGLTRGPNMINRTLARRLQDLEAEFLPVVREPMILRIDLVERDGAVVDHKEFTGERAGPAEPANPPVAAKIASDTLLQPQAFTD